MAVTRIKNNQIFDKTITAQKIADQTLVGTLFNPNLTLNSNITITGNLAVLGDSTTISSTNTYVNDPLVVFNNGYTGLPTYDVGMLINRNLNPFNTAWVWNEADKAFVSIYTSESGGTVGTINVSGYTTIKTGNLLAVTSATVSNVKIEGNDLSSTTGNLTISPTSLLVVNSDVLPGVTSTYDLGSAANKFDIVYSNSVNLNGAVLATSGLDVTITPVSGGNTIVSNLVISGSSSTFTGNVVTSNAAITGGTIDGTSIGSTIPSDATFTSIVDLGAFTANGSNALISLAPTGTGTVTINPATTGSISNMTGSFTTLASSGATTLSATSATSLTTANVQVTGGAVSGTTITNSPISGASVGATTLSASGNTSLTTATMSGIVNITDTTQSTVTTDGALVVAGGVGIAKNLNVGEALDVNGVSTLGTIVVNSTGSISSTVDIALSSLTAVKIGVLKMPQVDSVAGSVMVTDGIGNITLQTIGASVVGSAITLGTPTVGTLVDNNPAIATWTSATLVTDAVDKLNEVLGKLVPPAPPAFPNGTLSVSSLSSGLRMTDFTQTNNTLTGSKQLAAGSSVSAYRRASSYSVNTFTNIGPGESGTVSVMKNGVLVGSRVIDPTLTNNGTYGELIISNNVDYGTITSKPLGFWNSFNVTASGTVAQGWNELYITDTAAGTTNVPVWYYDASAPGTPGVVVTSMAPTSENTATSSSVPHYTSTTVWALSGTATRLSGDLYPATDTFVTGTAGGSFQAPASVTYITAGVVTPLARNLYVASGNATFTTTAATINSTGKSTAGPSVSVNNSYATGSGAGNPGGTILTINTASTTVVNENNIVVGTFGSGGAASAVRVDGLGASATPLTNTITAWSSATALAAHEGAVVAGIAANDTTNYSVGYFPVGPDLSVGRTGTQYMTFRITRDATSKFNISITGKISGCQVAMPGSSLDTTALPTNGWITPTVSYLGAGVPGTGVGGNGSVGCGLGGTLAVGTFVTQSKTVTFGTETSFNSTGNYIYVRFVLAAGDSITSLSFTNPTN